MIQAYLFALLFIGIRGATGETAAGLEITTVVGLLIYAYWSIRNGRVRIFYHEITQDISSRGFIIAVG